jgi:hypothetical protein
MTIYRGKVWPFNYLPPDEYEAESVKEDERRKTLKNGYTIFSDE